MAGPVTPKVLTPLPYMSEVNGAGIRKPVSSSLVVIKPEDYNGTLTFKVQDPGDSEGTPNVGILLGHHSMLGIENAKRTYNPSKKEWIIEIPIRELIANASPYGEEEVSQRIEPGKKYTVFVKFPGNMSKGYSFALQLSTDGLEQYTTNRLTPKEYYAQLFQRMASSGNYEFNVHSLVVPHRDIDAVLVDKDGKEIDLEANPDAPGSWVYKPKTDPIFNGPYGLTTLLGAPNSGWTQVDASGAEISAKKAFLKQEQAQLENNGETRRYYTKTIFPKDFSGEMLAAYEKLDPENRAKIQKDGMRVKIRVSYYLETDTGYKKAFEDALSKRPDLFTVNGHRYGGIDYLISKGKRDNPDAHKSMAIFFNFCNSSEQADVPLMRAFPGEILPTAGTTGSFFGHPALTMATIDGVATGNVEGLPEKLAAMYRGLGTGSIGADPSEVYNITSNADGDYLPVPYDPEPNKTNSYYYDPDKKTLTVLASNGQRINIQNVNTDSMYLGKTGELIAKYSMPKEEFNRDMGVAGAAPEPEANPEAEPDQPKTSIDVVQ
jgi:hypothetical protein